MPDCPCIPPATPAISGASGLPDTSGLPNMGSASERGRYRLSKRLWAIEIQRRLDLRARGAVTGSAAAEPERARRNIAAS